MCCLKSKITMPVLDFFLDFPLISHFLLVEGIHITRDIQVVVVLLDLAPLGGAAELGDALPFPVGADDALDVLGAELVLIAHLFKALTGVDEDDVVGILSLLFQHQNAGGDAGAVEDVGREADDGIEVIAIFDEVAADVPLGTATEEHAVRKDAGHGGADVQMVDHLLDEGEVGLGLRGQFAIGAEAVVSLMENAGGPDGREGRIGDDGLEAQVGVLGGRMLQGVLVLQVEALVVDAVQDRVHAGEVVGGGVHLLPKLQQDATVAEMSFGKRMWSCQRGAMFLSRWLGSDTPKALVALSPAAVTILPNARGRSLLLFLSFRGSGFRRLRSGFLCRRISWFLSSRFGRL